MDKNNEPRLVYYSALEALIKAFVTSRNPELEQKLHELCGFTNRQTKASIPAENYVTVLHYLATLFYPNLPMDEAFKAIGRSAVDGYKHTILGRIQFAALKLMSPARAARISPSNLRQNSNFGTITYEELTSNKYLFKFSDTSIPGAFVAGNFEAGLEITRAKNVRASHRKTGPESFELILEWD